MVAAAGFLAVQRRLSPLCGSAVEGWERGEEQEGLRRRGDGWNGHGGLQESAGRRRKISPGRMERFLAADAAGAHVRRIVGL